MSRARWNAFPSFGDLYGGLFGLPLSRVALLFLAMRYTLFSPSLWGRPVPLLAPEQCEVLGLRVLFSMLLRTAAAAELAMADERDTS